MQNGPRQLPGLAPGQRVPLTLRWDPTGNAGDKILWVHLRPATGSELGTDQATSITIQALTKALLKIGKTQAVATQRERDTQHRITLKAEVRNEGQTDAHNVMVSFYRSPLLTSENMLGAPVELKRVPGGGSAEAVFEWHFDPLRDLVRGTQFRPVVQVYLKGSSQRVSNVE